MADIPKNMEVFNLVTLRVFDRLYEAFPQPIDISPASIGIEITADETDSDAWNAMLVADSTFSWLATEGFLRYERPDTGKFLQAQLTLKGLTILGSVPTSIQQSETPETMIKKIKRVLSTGAQGASADAVKSVLNEVFGLALRASVSATAIINGWALIGRGSRSGAAGASTEGPTGAAVLACLLESDATYRRSPMTDTRTPLYDGSVVMDGRMIQVVSGFADPETDAWRQAELRFWAGVISGEHLRRGQTSHELSAMRRHG